MGFGVFREIGVVWKVLFLMTGNIGRAWAVMLEFFFARGASETTTPSE